MKRGLRSMDPVPTHVRGRRAALCGGLLLALAVACAPGDYRPIATGDRAPAYAGATLAGDTVSLARLRGEPVLLNIWATWCPPCREEMPLLQALHEEYGPRGLRVIGVSIDARGAESAIREFVEEYGIGFTILYDPDGRVTRAFRSAGVPETFLIGRNGRVAGRWIGMLKPSDPTIRERIEKALGGE
ncbi:MAG: TlpA family protein disulfide reductase [Symbiobacteriaceae bacterium]